MNSTFVSPLLWKAICKKRGAYAARHLHARYPSNVFYILPQGLEWYSFHEIEYDPSLNVFAEKLQEQVLAIAPIKHEAYGLWNGLSKENKGRVDNEEVWALAVATALAATEEPGLHYLTAKDPRGLCELPVIVYDEDQLRSCVS